jgi:hypothetical protein
MEQANPAFGPLDRLTTQFTEMLRTRPPEQVQPWLERVQASDFGALKSLATGMARE